MEGIRFRGQRLSPGRLCCLVMSILSAALLSLFTFAASSSAAGDAAAIASLSSQLNSENAAKATALNTISIAGENAAPKEKEMKLWNDQDKVIGAEVETYKKKFDAHQKDAAEVNQKVGVHNAGCSGTLPKPQFDRCKGEEPYLQSQIDRINTNKQRLEGERDNLQRRISSIEKRRNELIQDLNKIYASRDNAKKRLETAERNIANLKSRLQTECRSAKTPEAISHCGQVDWDGARSNVPDGSQHKPGGTPFFGK